MATSPIQALIGNEYTFRASTVSGLTCWLKADSLAATLNDGDAVGTWADSSGNSVDATQATAGLKPLFKTAIIGGRPVVRFDGSDDEMTTPTFTQNAAGTVFCVLVRRSSTVQFGRVYEIGNNNNFAVVNGTATTDLVAQLKDGLPTTLAPAYTVGQTYITTLQRDGGSPTNTGTAFLNGVQTGTITGAPTTGALSLFLSRFGGGAGFHTQTDIAEILVYNVLLSTADRRTVERYLGSKYSIVMQ